PDTKRSADLRGIFLVMFGPAAGSITEGTGLDASRGDGLFDLQGHQSGAGELQTIHGVFFLSGSRGRGVEGPSLYHSPAGYCQRLRTQGPTLPLRDGMACSVGDHSLPP